MQSLSLSLLEYDLMNYHPGCLLSLFTLKLSAL